MDKSKITCNGTTLTFDGQNYSASATNNNGSLQCKYTWNAGITSIPTPIQTQLAPTIETHGNLITVHYNPDGGDGCEFKVDASDGTHTVNATSTQDTGSIRGIDISSLSGSGTVTLTRVCTLKSANAGFKSLDVTYTATETLDISR
jgi:hypothetical protein